MTAARVQRFLRDVLRAALKDLAPPLVVNVWRRFTGPWRGNYRDWDAAAARSTGYEQQDILQRTTASVRQVLAGQKAFERDSIAFDRILYPWPLLAILLRVAQDRDHGAQLRVIDFGGALGSTYLRVRHFLGDDRIDWNIVELPAVAARGRELFGDGPPRFFSDLDDAAGGAPADVLVLSSVLPYLRDPLAFAARAASLRIPWVLIDRTYVTRTGGPSRLTVQHVHPDIYKASYPSWILNRDALLQAFGTAYELFAEFDAPDRLNVAAYSKGFALRYWGRVVSKPR